MGQFLSLKNKHRKNELSCKLISIHTPVGLEKKNMCKSESRRKTDLFFQVTNFPQLPNVVENDKKSGKFKQFKIILQYLAKMYFIYLHI